VFEKKYFDVRQFIEVPHPYILKEFHNGFTWTLPFLVDKIMEIIKAISERRIDRREVFRIKVLSVARMILLLKKIRIS